MMLKKKENKESEGQALPMSAYLYARTARITATPTVASTQKNGMSPNSVATPALIPVVLTAATNAWIIGSSASIITIAMSPLKMSFILSTCLFLVVKVKNYKTQ